MRSQNSISRSHFVSKECWTGLVSAFQSLWAAMNFSVRRLKCPPSVKMRIAGLRLWLSLAVDYQGEEPQPLPNLKYKIEVGDSLISPNPTEIKLTDVLIEKYRQIKAEYIKTHNGDRKKVLEKEITKLKKEISLITYGNDKVDKFDWSLDFAEVFADGGFDVVVANPPYVRQELIKHLKPSLKKVFPEVYTGTADLYCFFYARAVELSKQGGMLAFISSNKWLRAKYGEKLRKYIADNCQVDSVTDFGSLPVFESASTFPMIFIANNRKAVEKSITFTQVKFLKKPTYTSRFFTIKKNQKKKNG